jgi:Flp pilus assembly pilin Flp
MPGRLVQADLRPRHLAFSKGHGLTSIPGSGIMGAALHFLASQFTTLPLEGNMSEFIRKLWSEDEGQDIAEYAVMLAVILVLVVGTIRLIGSNANNVFSNTASSIQ